MKSTIAQTILVGTVIAATLFMGCEATVPIPRGVSGSGKIVTKEINYRDFTRIEIGSVFEVKIVEGGSYLIKITANDNLFDYINVTQEGETLKIKLTPNYNYRDVTLRAEISLPKLTGVYLYGATEGTIRGFQSSNDFNLRLSGASSLNIDMETGDVKFYLSGATKVIGSLEARNAEFQISEASNIELQGSANKMSLGATGASKVELADFTLEQADISLSGASEANVTVNGRLDIAISGASKLCYKGDPMIGDISVSDTSTIKRR